MKSTEYKIIISVVLFTLFIVGLERYQLSQSITEQFISSKKSKNELLVNTVTPILALNASLGLEAANREYLEQIKELNSDLEFIYLRDRDAKILYEYTNQHYNNQQNLSDYNYVKKEIKDDFTQKKLLTLEFGFSNFEYENMLKTNRKITINITIITIVLLLIFVLFMKHMFKNLKELRESVLAYDPQLNNFPLGTSDKKDEITLIKNAIVAMVEKINHYTEMLDSTNALLEEKVKQRTLELEESNKELKLLASVDPLTSLYNRRYFTKTSEQVLEISKRNMSDLSVIMLDIDNFKSINDTYGHHVGDDVIVSVAKILIEMTRKSDIVCRFGGEEFIVLLPETNLDGAYAIAQKIRVRVEREEIEIQNTDSISVTISIGVAGYNRKVDSSIESIIKKADEAMYLAKTGGKNMSCIKE